MEKIKVNASLKSSRKKKLIKYKGAPTRQSADFSAEILQVRREWHDIFKIMKEKKRIYNQEYSSSNFIIQVLRIDSFTSKEKVKAEPLEKTLMLGKIEGKQLKVSGKKY